MFSYGVILFWSQFSNSDSYNTKKKKKKKQVFKATPKNIC